MFWIHNNAFKETYTKHKYITYIIYPHVWFHLYMYLHIYLSFCVCVCIYVCRYSHIKVYHLSKYVRCVMCECCSMMYVHKYLNNYIHTIIYKFNYIYSDWCINILACTTYIIQISYKSKNLCWTLMGEFKDIRNILDKRW